MHPEHPSLLADVVLAIGKMALAAWLFGIWSVLRLPTFFIFFAPEFGPFEKVLHVLFTVFVIGITFLAIKRYIDLGKLREKFSKDPEKYKNVKIEGPPVLTTIIPFLLK